MHEFGRNVAVIAAHPDDEALGCGGTIARLTQSGVTVNVLFLTTGVASRTNYSGGEEESQRKTSAQNAAAILGISSIEFCDFPDNKLDSVALLDVVQKIEAWLASTQATTVLTHFANDLNIDHEITHRAVMTACRPQAHEPVTTILSFEVPSSTEWSLSSKPAFHPTTLVDISTTHDKKLQALACYHQELRAAPHSRSLSAISALNQVRGEQNGMNFAEAFQVERLLYRQKAN